MNIDVKVKLENGAFMPNKAHSADAGFDLYTPSEVVVPAHNSVIIDTKVHMIIPEGYVGMIKSKSGLNVKYGLTSEGVVDAGYTGPIMVKMYNHSKCDYRFSAGDKLTQIVIMPIPDVNLIQIKSIEEVTERGNNGFGSSGK